jgi:peptidoglycan/LPS O-acetylase OafA/YrhL
LLYQGWDFARCLFHHWPVAAYRYGWLVATVGCAGILISVFGSQTLQRTLNYRPIVLLGRISYSVYLLQFIIILCLLPPLVAMFNQLGVTQPLVLCPVTMLASVAATIGCATIMYRFVEFRSFSSATGSPRQSSCDSKSKGKPCVNLKVGTARCAGKKNG